MDIILLIVFAVVGIILGFLIAKPILAKQNDAKLANAKTQIQDAQDQANRIKQAAYQEAEAAKKESLLAAKEEALEVQRSQEHKIEQQRAELRIAEAEFKQNEQNLTKKQQGLAKKEQWIKGLQSSLAKKQTELDKALDNQASELARIAQLSKEEAHEELLSKVKKDVVAEEARIIRESQERAKAEADRNAQRILSIAIQRSASDQTNEVSVTSVQIPSDDIKGRIIGREGRNIRTFEQVTGVSLVIDDTPETVVLSSFEPVRRETARVTLENLIADGRIHPARIEELYKKAEKLVGERVIEAGEQAAFDMGIHDLNPEIIKTLGALRYRMSYGQNVLTHSKQVAEFAALIASELGVDIASAKRAGLLHDLGKAIDHSVEGPHAVIGADLAQRHHEQPEIVHAIEAHHGDVEPNSVLDVIIQAADAISAARPGARRESAEAYFKRLQRLEEISNAHSGVEKTYAMQAGREIHVMVEPEKIDDAEATVLAHDIAAEIEKELQYPGQVRVVVIRESRAVDYAK